MKICSLHQIPVIHKSGISTKTGKAYSFDACPEKAPDGGFCNAPVVESPMAQASNGNPTSTPDWNKSLGEETKIDWDAKDRQSMAQTAMKSASEIMGALLTSGAYNTEMTEDGDFRNHFKEDVNKLANEFFKEIRRMKNTDLL